MATETEHVQLEVGFNDAIANAALASFVSRVGTQLDRLKNEFTSFLASSSASGAAGVATGAVSRATVPLSQQSTQPIIAQTQALQAQQAVLAALNLTTRQFGINQAGTVPGTQAATQAVQQQTIQLQNLYNARVALNQLPPAPVPVTPAATPTPASPAGGGGVGGGSSNQTLREIQIAAFGISQAGQLLDRFVTQNLVGLAQFGIQAALQLENAETRLKAVTGSASETTRQLEVLRKVALLPGIDLPTAVQEAASLQALRFSFEETTRILIQFSNAIALSGGTKENLQGVLIQLQQMSQQSKVLSSDLKPILTQVPLIGTILKDAFGTVSSQDIQKLGIAPKELIETIIAGLEKLPRAALTFQERLANLEQAAQAAFRPIGDAILNILIPAFEALAPALGAVSGFFGGLPQPVQLAIIAIGAMVAAIGPLLVIVGSLALALTSIAQVAALYSAGALAVVPQLFGISAAVKFLTADVAVLGTTLTISTGGLILLVGALAVAGVALYRYANSERELSNVTAEQIKGSVDRVTALNKEITELESYKAASGGLAEHKKEILALEGQLSIYDRARVHAIGEEAGATEGLSNKLTGLIKLKEHEIEIERQRQGFNLSQLTDDFLELLQKSSNLHQEITRVTEGMNAYAKAAEEARNPTKQLHDALGDAEGITVDYDKTARQFADQITKLETDQAALAEQVKKIGQELDKAAKATGKSTEELLRARVETGNYSQSVFQAVDALGSLTAAQKKQETATEAANRALQDQINKFKELAGLKVADVGDVRGAQKALQDAAAKEGKSVNDVLNDPVTLNRVRTQVKGLKDSIIKDVGSLGPAGVKAATEALGISLDTLRKAEIGIDQRTKESEKLFKADKPNKGAAAAARHDDRNELAVFQEKLRDQQRAEHEVDQDRKRALDEDKINRRQYYEQTLQDARFSYIQRTRLLEQEAEAIKKSSLPESDKTKAQQKNFDQRVQATRDFNGKVADANADFRKHEEQLEQKHLDNLLELQKLAHDKQIVLINELADLQLLTEQEAASKIFEFRKLELEQETQQLQDRLDKLLQKNPAGNDETEGLGQQIGKNQARLRNLTEGQAPIQRKAREKDLQNSQRNDEDVSKSDVNSAQARVDSLKAEIQLERVNIAERIRLARDLYSAETELIRQKAADEIQRLENEKAKAVQTFDEKLAALEANNGKETDLYRKLQEQKEGVDAEFRVRKQALEEQEQADITARAKDKVKEGVAGDLEIFLQGLNENPLVKEINAQFAKLGNNIGLVERGVIGFSIAAQKSLLIVRESMQNTGKLTGEAYKNIGLAALSAAAAIDKSGKVQLAVEAAIDAVKAIRETAAAFTSYAEYDYYAAVQHGLAAIQYAAAAIAAGKAVFATGASSGGGSGAADRAATNKATDVASAKDKEQEINREVIIRLEITSRTDEGVITRIAAQAIKQNSAFRNLLAVSGAEGFDAAY